MGLIAERIFELKSKEIGLRFTLFCKLFFLKVNEFFMKLELEGIHERGYFFLYMFD